MTGQNTQTLFQTKDEIHRYYDKDLKFKFEGNRFYSTFGSKIFCQGGVKNKKLYMAYYEFLGTHGVSMCTFYSCPVERFLTKKKGSSKEFPFFQKKNTDIVMNCIVGVIGIKRGIKFKVSEEVKLSKTGEDFFDSFMESLDLEQNDFLPSKFKNYEEYELYHYIEDEALLCTYTNMMDFWDKIEKNEVLFDYKILQKMGIEFIECSNEILEFIVKKSHSSLFESDKNMNPDIIEYFLEDHPKNKYRIQSFNTHYPFLNIIYNNRDLIDQGISLRDLYRKEYSIDKAKFSRLTNLSFPKNCSSNMTLKEEEDVLKLLGKLDINKFPDKDKPQDIFMFFMFIMIIKYGCVLVKDNHDVMELLNKYNHSKGMSNYLRSIFPFKKEGSAEEQFIETKAQMELLSEFVYFFSYDVILRTLLIKHRKNKDIIQSLFSMNKLIELPYLVIDTYLKRGNLLSNLNKYKTSWITRIPSIEKVKTDYLYLNKGMWPLLTTDREYEIEGHKIIGMTSAKELSDLSEVYSNCVGGYSNRVINGDDYIFNVIDPEENPAGCLSISGYNTRVGDFKIKEFKDHSNRKVSEDSSKVAKKFIKKINTKEIDLNIEHLKKYAQQVKITKAGRYLDYNYDDESMLNIGAFLGHTVIKYQLKVVNGVWKQYRDFVLPSRFSQAEAAHLVDIDPIKNFLTKE